MIDINEMISVAILILSP